MSSSFFDDQVRLKLDGHEVPIVSRYTVLCGMMGVPAAFSLTVGHGGIFRDLASAFPPETPFEMYVGDKLVQTGELDSIEAAEQATEARLGGRDMLRRLVDGQIDSEQTFSESTYLALTLAALKTVGLGDSTVFSDNAANLAAVTGKEVIQLAPAASGADDAGSATVDASPATLAVYKAIKAKCGRTWFEFLAEQNRRAGLFLWADHSGNFVLSRPNGNKDPIYRIIRKQTGQADGSSVLGRPSFRHDITQRYTECVVLGRGGGGKEGRHRFLGSFVDDEMVAILNPNPADRANGGTRKKRLVIEDDHVRTIAQANLLARRKIAESRRNGWKLSYIVSGHTVPALKGGGRIPWTQDTVLQVVDDEFGIEGPMYIESVQYEAQMQKTTRLNLMRCEDLVFAEEPDQQPRHALAQKPGVVPPKSQNVKIHLDNNDFWHVVPT